MIYYNKKFDKDGSESFERKRGLHYEKEVHMDQADHESFDDTDAYDCSFCTGYGRAEGS